MARKPASTSTANGLISRGLRRLRGSDGGKHRHPPVPDQSSEATDAAFREMARRLNPDASVVEFGTRRSDEESPTYLHCLCPQVPRENYLLADIQPGIDVDELADLHALPGDWSGRFDALIAVAVFEHLERPWIAAREVARVLAPGGFCFIATHQTYPLHGHPRDFFRFSREALALIFEDAGLRIVDVSYRHRAKIILPASLMKTSDSAWWNEVWPSYVAVELLAEKPA